MRKIILAAILVLFAADANAARSTMFSQGNGGGLLNADNAQTADNYTVTPTGSGTSDTLENLNYGRVAGLVYGKTEAAANNTTILQTALTAHGMVDVQCPSGSVVYINSTLKIYSDTRLNIGVGCTLKALANTGALLVNNASQMSWTTLYNNSGLITNGPLSMIGGKEIPAWSSNGGSGTAYVKGKYVHTADGVYWERATSCTGNTSGSGPSGTGTGIADGSCVWDYVTAWSPTVSGGGSNAGTNLFALINWPSHGLSVGDTVWVTPQPDNSASSNLWTGTQSAHTVGGPCDGAFFGLFRVSSVNDGGWITVSLRILPETAFSGIPLNIKKSDKNISISGGGVLDYNYPTNNIPNQKYNSHNIVMAGVDGLIIDNIISGATAKYNLTLAGTRNVNVGNFNTVQSGSNSDRIKVYGPAFDINIHDSHGPNGDDIVSLQTQDTSSFTQFIIACGDIIGVVLDNIQADSGNAVGIYASHNLLLTDNVDIGHISIHSTQAGAGSTPVFIAGNTVSLSAPVGIVNIHNVTVNDYSSALLSMGGGKVSIKQLNMFHNQVNATNNGKGGMLLNYYSASGSVIDQVNIRENSAQEYGFFVSASGSGAEITNLNIEDNNISYIGSNNYVNGIVQTISGGVIKNISIRNNYFQGNFNYIILDRYGMNISYENNVSLNTYGMLDIAHTGTTTLKMGGNSFGSLTYALLKFDSAGTLNLTSMGGNSIASGSWFASTPGGIITAYGWDIRGDVTKMTRTTGSYFYNTNASPGSGTLTTVGPVMDQGTGANSWFSLSNPLLQQY